MPKRKIHIERPGDILYFCNRLNGSLLDSVTLDELNRLREAREHIRSSDHCGRCWTWMHIELNLGRVKRFDRSGATISEREPPEPGQDPPCRHASYTDQRTHHQHPPRTRNANLHRHPRPQGRSPRAAPPAP